MNFSDLNFQFPDQKSSCLNNGHDYKNISVQIKAVKKRKKEKIPEFFNYNNDLVLVYVFYVREIITSKDNIVENPK